MKKKIISKFLSFFAGVVDPDKHSFVNISVNFSKKFEMVLMGYSGARGTLIYEKNLMSKISCQTPFERDGDGAWNNNTLENNFGPCSTCYTKRSKI